MPNSQFGLLEILLTVGFVIFLAVLIALLKAASALKKAAASLGGKETKAVPVPVNAKNAAALKQEGLKPLVKKPDDEIIAVITAAVAAFTGAGGNELVVRSYRRIKSGKPSWNKAGRHEMLSNY